ncbi:anti-sigma factor family protein [Foetidibacter luteolus]|uniref:anti-sigma factor family protein n=1 Tax=Foetidibacter luteolus TaxID=2608880 RepID=UPI00129B96A4|nr:hypothetical protein [Foetidibacter luteolus]
MAVNRQNYEEYFLLYVDDELSIHQRMEVEWFVQQNADLAAELELLQQARLLPDEKLGFGNKANLYKITQSHINLANYEEYFLLYIDNELSADERKDVEKFVLQHPQLQQEFTLLQQTTLPPETVEFKQKDVLYRRKKERRIIAMRWWRLAAAAVLVLAISGTVVWYAGEKESSQEQGLVTIDKSQQPATGTQPQVQQKANEQPAVAQQSAQPAQQTGTDRKPGKEAQQAPVTANTKTPQENSKQRQPANTVSLPDEEIAGVETAKPVTNDAVVIPVVKQPEDAPIIVGNLNRESSITVKPSITTETTGSNNATPVATTYKELDTDIDAEQRTVYVGSMQLNKSKVKNLLKKASRLFGNKNEEDIDNGKLQIASFEIDKENK